MAGCQRDFSRACANLTEINSLATIPEQEWDKLPRDAAKNIDHYLYGTPKEEEDE